MTLPESPVATLPPDPARRIHSINTRHAPHDDGKVAPDAQFHPQGFKHRQRWEVNQDKDAEKQPDHRL